MLAGLFKAPTKYSPDVNLPAARARANDVLSNLVDAGFMTEGQVYAARRNPATPITQDTESNPNWYLDFAFDEVKALADSGKLGADRVLTVRTGLDTGLQDKMDSVLEDMLRVNAPAYNAHQAAAVVGDTDGLVRAMFGGRDYGASQFNRATDAARQPGSSFKIFDYMTALLTGKYHKDTTVQAGGICIGDYCVHNFGGESGGAMPLYQALAQSYNTAAIWISVKIGEVYWPAGKPYHQAKIAELGRSKIIETARKMGLTTPLIDTVSLPVGADEVKMIDMLGANAMLANGGKRATPYAAIEIRNSAGAVDLHPRRQRDAARPGAAGRQGRRDEQHLDPRAHRGHRARRADPGPRHLRQDRHDKWADQRLVQRLHRQSGRQRLVRQRRQLVDERQYARRRAAGADLARDHGLRAPGPRDQAALWRAARWRTPRSPPRRRPRAAPASSKRRGRSACRRSRRTSSSRSATTPARPRSTAASRPPSVTRPTPAATSPSSAPARLRPSVALDFAGRAGDFRAAARQRSPPSRRGTPHVTMVVKALAAGAIGLALGVAASGSILADPPFGAVTIGPWRVAAKAGSLEADPYTRAALARSGEIPLALGEGLKLVARVDSAGRPLDRRCLYRVGTHTPAARYWTLSLTDADGYPVENAAGRYGFRSSEILRDGDGELFRFMSRRSPMPATGCRSAMSRRFALALRLYDTPLAASAGGIEKSSVPTIEREGCA